MSKNFFQQSVPGSDISSIDFHSFDPSLHHDPEQIKRRISAKKIKENNITNCGDHYEIVGSSGDIYNTSLNTCTCFDFANRGLPCKHVYRFALDHGQIEDLPKISLKNSKLFAEKINSEIEHFHSYYELRTNLG